MDRLGENQQTLQEFFAAPTGLKKVASLDGEDLFGSPSLNLSFLKSMSESSRAKPLMKTMTRLVMNKKLVPCWMNKNILKFYKFKIFGPAHKKIGAAFYAPKHGKIFVLIDNNISSFGFASNDWLAVLTIHEMCHLMVGLKPAQFKSSFKPIYTEFYKNYFVDAFKLTKQPRVDKFTNFIYQNFDVKSKLSYALFKKYREHLDEFKSLSVLKDKEFDMMADLIVNAILLSVINFNIFSNNYYKKYASVVRPIINSYKTLVGNKITNVNSMFYQELYIPSEVIAILSEIPSSYSSKIYSGLSKL